jgi:hypothetical protein
VTAKFDFASFHRSPQRREQISAIDSSASVILKCAEISPQCKKPMDSQPERCSILLDVASVDWAFAFGNAGLG